MDVITFEAKSRMPGKQGARAARRQKEVPCVLYGNKVDPVSFQVPEFDLERLVYTHETHIVKVEVDGQSWECVLKDMDFHPVTDRPIHADFQVLQQGEKITLTVPVQFHGTPAGQIEGGDTQYVLHELEVTCLPKDIPSHIDLDVAHLQIGDAIHISDLNVEGVTFGGALQQTIVTVVAPRLQAEPAEAALDEELELELGEGEEGAAEEEEGEDQGEAA
jgi:large subunit ribosomal protein L25